MTYRLPVAIITSGCAIFFIIFADEETKADNRRGSAINDNAARQLGGEWFSGQ